MLIFSTKTGRFWVIFWSDFSNTGWWFGTWLLFFHILGFSSSQLTNSYFPTSLCGVLVFRLDPATSPPPSVRRVRPPRRLHNSSQPHFSHLTYHSTTHQHQSPHFSQHNSSQLHFSHLTYHITTPHSSTSHTSLRTPHLSHPHLSHHLSHHHSSQLHFSHLTHHIITAQLITAPWSADCLSRGRCSAAAFCVAGAVHRASWSSCGTHGRGPAARLPFVWQAQYTEPPGRAAARMGDAGPRLPFVWQAQCTEPPGRAGPAARLPFVWQAQYTEPPGRAVAHVGAAGPRLPFVWQAQWQAQCFRVAAAVHRASWSSWPSGAAAFRVAGAVHSLLVELWRTWAPLGRGGCRVAGGVHRASWSSCGVRGRRWAAAAFRGRRSTQSLLVELRRVWAPLDRGCLSCGRLHHSSTSHTSLTFTYHISHLAAFRVAGAVQYTMSVLVELRRAWAPLGRGCLSCGRRSKQSLLVELRRAWAPLGRGCLSCGRRSTQSLLVELRRAWAPLGRGCLSCGRRSTQSLLVSCGARGGSSTFHHNSSQLHFSHLTYHTSLFTSQPITAPLLTPSFTHPLWHTIFDTPSFTPSLTHHLSHHFVTHNLSHATLSHHLSHTQLCHTPSFAHHLSHTSSFTRNFVTHHLSSTSSFVFPSIPVPATTFLAHYWKTLTCGVIRSF